MEDPRAATPITTDLCIYGSTISGIAAALSAARMGVPCLLVSPTRHFGGMLTGGLSRTDIGKSETVGGIFREFLEAVKTHYWNEFGKNSPPLRECRDGIHFEPSVARNILSRMLEKHRNRLDLLLPRYAGLRVKETGQKNGALRTLTLAVVRPELDATGSPEADDITVTARVFIDASYEGDLAAAAGVPYRVGRESREEFGEPHAGHIFWNPSSPEPDPESTGTGDARVQAYCYRLCLTKNAKNLVPFEKPAGYDRETYRLLERYLREKGSGDLKDYILPAVLPNAKLDVNNWGFCWQSMDLVGADDGYPDGSWEEREKIARRHREYQLGWWHFLQHDLAVPKALRQECRNYGLCRDEFRETGHWSPQLYVREARRFHGRAIFTEMDARQESLKPDAIALGSYPLDSHATSWYQPGQRSPTPEGFFICSTRPYEIPFGILVPETTEGILVSTCVSATHAGWGTLRMEPVFCALGQAAGTAAALALWHGISPSSVDTTLLQQELLKQGQVIKLPGKGR